MGFPTERPRRLRRSPMLRRLVQETHLSVRDLIYPLFVVPGRGVRRPIASMPGVARVSVDELVKDVQEAANLGILAVILFGIPEKKDARATASHSDSGIVQQAVRAIKDQVSEILVVTDVCLCEYTDHGHCGVVKGDQIENDPSLELLSLQAVSHARAGADIVAPSDMMDGRVGAIRRALDGAGYADTALMAYAAKYASAFYGPFREAAQSAPQFGDRRSYQMDAANAREALREVALDVEEGADIVMVKPALPYLDIVRRVRDRFDLPVAAYQVSGEYAMIKAAAQSGWLEEERVILESLISIKRAGADMILTYFAKQAAMLLARA